jgi:hypothetical protein
LTPNRWGNIRLAQCPWPISRPQGPETETGIIARDGAAAVLGLILAMLRSILRLT